MYTLNITKTIKNMYVNDIREDGYRSLKRLIKRFFVVCEQINRKST